MNNKKSQAAMEFLMTYGWAILIVLIVLAALFFLGVFNPKSTNTCIVTAPFTCTDVKASGTTLTLVLAASGTYSAGPTIAAAGVTINGVASSAGGGTISTVTPTAITWTIPSQTVGSKFSGTSAITYTQSGGTSHTKILQFSGVAE